MGDQDDNIAAVVAIASLEGAAQYMRQRNIAFRSLEIYHDSYEFIGKMDDGCTVMFVMGKDPKKVHTMLSVQRPSDGFPTFSVSYKADGTFHTNIGQAGNVIVASPPMREFIEELRALGTASKGLDFDKESSVARTLRP